jgi:hypothetical protein
VQRSRSKLALSLALVAAAAVSAAAGPPAQARSADRDKDDDRPTEKVPGLKSRVFDVKHRDPDDIARVLKPLGSGVRGTSIAESGEFRTITVRDFPENIAAMEEALRRLDVPRPPRPDVELSVRVLIATPTGPGQYPRELEPVVKQLHATLNYKSYYQINTITQRVKAGGGSKGKGVTVINPPVSGAEESSTMNYSYGFEDVSIAQPPAGATGKDATTPKVQVRRLFYWTGGKALGEADINTGLTLREGEKVVVGTASLKDRAMILVLSARIVK